MPAIVRMSVTVAMPPGDWPGNGSIAVTEPPGIIIALALPSVPVVVSATTDESAFWNTTRMPTRGSTPWRIVRLTGPKVQASTSASGGGGASGK